MIGTVHHRHLIATSDMASLLAALNRKPEFTTEQYFDHKQLSRGSSTYPGLSWEREPTWMAVLQAHEHLGNGTPSELMRAWCVRVFKPFCAWRLTVNTADQKCMFGYTIDQPFRQYIGALTSALCQYDFVDMITERHHALSESDELRDIYVIEEGTVVRAVNAGLTGDNLSKIIHYYTEVCGKRLGSSSTGRYAQAPPRSLGLVYRGPGGLKARRSVKTRRKYF
ncbi:uncharacterized protein EV422DRAFT_207329 [Fimicolochytrium jonesii]|uniref:uncharacterized protein n=1 Tax=Fimicolochytrium jonesii TaxID=1396493 RepID=UPI0022FEBED5|nr:uncharacterized protein EV422DRAFT_207329 [Fimicolochytrium jonesii]KAI8817830.1 hypothetical protein EV422DRAFT_207329 [Fimicolochytrium jonesii]